MNSKPFLYVLVAINVLPHAEDLPLWVIAFSLGFVVWSFAADRSALPRPNRWISGLFGLLCAWGVWNQFGVIWGDPASTALLVLLVGVKLFELDTYRDVMVTTYLLFFILMSKMLTSQTIAMSIFMFCDVVVLVSLMASYHVSMASVSLVRLLKMSLRLALMAIPVLILMFVLFPRFQTDIFGRPRPPTGVVGFSEELSPGAFSKLQQSDEVAFRVSSDDLFPPPNQLYWRGTTLDESQGLVWRKSSGFEKSLPRKPTEMLHTTRFEVMLEPSATRWLFTLDWPLWLEFPDDPNGLRALRSEGFVYESRLPALSRTLYSFYSNPNFTEIPWQTDALNLNRYLRLGDVEAPRSRIWLNQILRKQGKPSQVVFDILEFYKANFRYSLEPPPVQNMDEFLFETKVGFCEHFAGSMATLLRMAGIPSRVVVGFHGGMSSALGNFISVRMLDAHAWLEYWDANELKWRRVDPTAVVAPQRLLLGAEQFTDSELSKIGRLNSRYPVLSKLFGSEVSKFYFRGRKVLDQAESVWIQFLLRFDYDYQRRFLENLGLKVHGRWSFVVALFVVMAFTVMLLNFIFQRRRDPVEPEVKIYQKLLRKLAKRGFNKLPSEGPLEFERRVLRSYSSPELKTVFLEWRNLRYASPRKSYARLQRFRERVSRLRLDSPQGQN